MAETLADARAAHSAWKSQVDAFFDKDEPINLQAAITPAESILGAWLRAGGKEKHGSSPDYDRLLSEQEGMHSIVMEVIEAKTEGSNDAQAAARENLNAAWAKVDELLGKLG